MWAVTKTLVNCLYYEGIFFLPSQKLGDEFIINHDNPGFPSFQQPVLREITPVTERICYKDPYYKDPYYKDPY